MTDIGPSMTGVKIPAPSFQGATPSEFEITAVTLNDESIENTCFVIDAETGEITINSTAETPVGEYKLTISCSVNGKYFTFKDIIKVTFLPRAPEGTVAEPICRKLFRFVRLYLTDILKEPSYNIFLVKVL